ncbi:MAG: class I SAM-dependent methyltransferase [Aeriscardovia sp.]|nr:class I SAM-dependent methyltransferase [Aeriscardovia sp.]
MDNTKNFDGYANDYTVGRPQYAGELIDYLYSENNLTESSVIADIGSGTGKFTAQLLVKGSEVYSVEPNADMRRIAEKELSSYKNFHSVCGDAENTNLGERSVDFITTAQAFHWFDVQKFRAECARILNDGGKAALIWNVRNMSDPVNQELYKIYTKYCPRFRGFSGGIVKDDHRIKEFFDGKYDYVSFDNPLRLDRETFIARSLSGSYSIKENDEGYEEYIKAVLDVFDRHSDNGFVLLANDSVAYTGSV